VFNQIVIRAALRLARTISTSVPTSPGSFQAGAGAHKKNFEEKASPALINTGAAPA